MIVAVVQEAVVLSRPASAAASRESTPKKRGPSLDDLDLVSHSSDPLTHTPKSAQSVEKASWAQFFEYEE